MPKRNATANYNTNLASEYLIMSLLSRMGMDAYLSLGNKKGVDIVITSESGKYALLEVKGVNQNMDWLINNSGVFESKNNLFYAFVAFNGKIDDLGNLGRVYIIPSSKVEYKISKNEKTVYVSHAVVRDNFKDYLNTFDCLKEFMKS